MTRNVRSTGGIEHPDLRHPVAQVYQLAAIGARFLQLLAQVVEEQRIGTFRMFGTLV